MRLKRDGSDSWTGGNSCGENSVKAANPRRPQDERDIAISAAHAARGDKQQYDHGAGKAIINLYGTEYNPEIHRKARALATGTFDTKLKKTPTA